MSKVEYVEGRRYAAQIAQSLLQTNPVYFKDSGRDSLIHNLRTNCEGRPEDYQKGIEDIIREIQKWS